MITFHRNNFGRGINRYAKRDGVIIATIHHHPHWKQRGFPDAWNVCRMTGRVDWFPTLAAARDDVLKG